MFELQEDELKKAHKWERIHKCKYRGEFGAIGGGIQYIFMPTGLGTLVEIKCDCGKKKSLRGSENW